MSASGALLRRDGLSSDGRRYLVRPSRASDAAALTALRDLVAAEGEYLAEAPGEHGIIELDAMLASLQGSGGLSLTLEVDGEVSGHLMVHRRAGLHFAHVGEIAIIVHNAQRGAGFGRALMDTASAWAVAVGVSKLSLRVLAGNLRAVAFYRALGFVDEGIARGEVRMPGGDRDLLLMARVL